MDPITYRVTMPDPTTHELHVEMRVPTLPAEGAVEIVFPAWAPGSYMVRDFVRHVYGLEIADERGTPVPSERLDKQRWRIESAGRPFRVRYRVFAFEASVRTSFLDDSHAYWNGTSVFFGVTDELARPCRVEVVPPDPSWRISTALPCVNRKARDGAQVFEAPSYDELVDAPFEVGRHAVFPFRVGATRFELALYGRTNADPARLVDVLRRVAAATGEIFGGFPFPRYVFIVHALPVGSGGLEHRDSVTLDISGMSFEDADGYQRFADLAAHELFHAWNVKRIRDTVLGPFDYTRENYTRMLWFHEGFTDYLANIIILRAGITNEARVWRWLSEDYPKYANRPGRNAAALTELSFEAWIKQYKPAENHINAAVSYYERGLWAGLVLDLLLRIETAGRRGLPEMFARIWSDCGQGARPISEDDVRAAASAIAGKPMGSFFERFIHGTDELPVPALLKRAGLEVRQPRAWEPDNPAATDRDRLKEDRGRAWSGVTLQAPPPAATPAVAADRAVIKNVVPDSPAARAGLTFGDEIVAVDGYRVTASSFARRVGDYRPGDPVPFAFFRREQLMEAVVRLEQNPERRLVLAPDPHADARALAIRQGWLGVPARASQGTRAGGRRSRR